MRLAAAVGRVYNPQVASTARGEQETEAGTHIAQQRALTFSSTSTNHIFKLPPRCVRGENATGGNGYDTRCVRGENGCDMPMPPRARWGVGTGVTNVAECVRHSAVLAYKVRDDRPSSVVGNHRGEHEPPHPSTNQHSADNRGKSVDYRDSLSTVG